MSEIPITSLPNLRDIGGPAAAGGGSVLLGKLYRSVDLGKLTPPDLLKVEELKLKTVFDLRTTAERDAEPDAKLPGVANTHLDILADMPEAAVANPLGILADPAQATAFLSGDNGARIFAEAYKNLVTLPSALAGYSSYLKALDGGASAPLLFHCTTGKDRTGWAAAITLTLLGVSREDVISDYLLTNTYLLPALQGLFDQFAAGGGDPELLRPVLGGEQSYIELAFRTVDEQFGSFDSYLEQGLGVDAPMRASLIERYVA